MFLNNSPLQTEETEKRPQTQAREYNILWYTQNIFSKYMQIYFSSLKYPRPKLSWLHSLAYQQKLIHFLQFIIQRKNDGIWEARMLREERFMNTHLCSVINSLKVLLHLRVLISYLEL